jgi:hypothetical protein
LPKSETQSSSSGVFDDDVTAITIAQRFDVRFDLATQVARVYRLRIVFVCRDVVVCCC